MVPHGLFPNQCQHCGRLWNQGDAIPCDCGRPLHESASPLASSVEVGAASPPHNDSSRGSGAATTSSNDRPALPLLRRSPRDRKRAVSRLALVVGAGAAGVLGWLVLVPRWFCSTCEEPPSWWLFGGALLVFLWLNQVTDNWVNWARLARPSGEERMEADSRSPVVYLRRFSQDPPGVEHRRRHEEKMARLLARIGPPIALGRPGEVLPPRGFSRVYVADADWQFVIGEYISQASLIVVDARGSSESFRWEMEQCISRGKVRRLLLLVDDLDAYREFSREHGAVFPSPLPKAIDQDDDEIGNGYAGAIWFDDKSRPKFDRFAKRWSASSTNLELVLTLRAMGLWPRAYASFFVRLLFRDEPFRKL
jgi:hypothetical protein